MSYNIYLFIFCIIIFDNCLDTGTGINTFDTPQFLGMENKIVTKIVYSKPYLYAGAAANGLWRCNLNENLYWEYLGLADTSLGAYSNVGVMDIDIYGNDILVAYNGSAPWVNPDSTVGIWRSIDGGIKWFRSDSGTPETIDFSIESNIISACRRSPDRPDIVVARFAIATYRSTDSGYHWELINGKRGIIGGDDHIRWHPFIAGEYWGFGSTSVFAPYMGAAVEYGLKSKGAFVDFHALGFPSDGFVSDMAFDCADPNIIYAATSQGVIKSVDGGYTWLNEIIKIPNSGYAYHIIEHRFKPGVLFLAGGAFVYYSIDECKTINLLVKLPVNFIESIDIDEDGERLFIGSGAGVYVESFSF